MPNNVAAAAPVGVLPWGACQAFSEQLRVENFTNTYPDGNSDRFALALNPRRFWKLTRRVDGTAYDQLWNFYKAHLNVPFYFYSVFETVPPYSYDPTGSNPIGRYVVVFDGSWSDELRLGRSSVSLALREVV